MMCFAFRYTRWAQKPVINGVKFHPLEAGLFDPSYPFIGVLNPHLLVSHEKNPGWLGFIGDEIPSSYMGNLNKPL